MDTNACCVRYVQDDRQTVGQRLGQGRRLEGKRKDGSLFPLLVTLSEVAGMGPNRRQFTAAMRDISQLMSVATELSTEKCVSVCYDSFSCGWPYQQGCMPKAAHRCACL